MNGVNVKLCLILTLAILAQGCLSLTKTVTRPDWLRCCKMCSKPEEMDYMEVPVLGDRMICHCMSGDMYIIEHKFDY